jgi:hypothetical protein
LALTVLLGRTNSNFLGGAGAWDYFLEDTATGGTLDINVSMGSTETKYGYGISRFRTPGDPDWATGNWTIELHLIGGIVGGTGRVRLHRYDGDGTLIESSSYSSAASFRVGGVKAWTFTSLAWTAGLGSDRLVVEYEMNTSGTSGTFSFRINSTGNEVITPLTQGDLFAVATAPEISASANTHSLTADASITAAVAEVSAAGNSPSLTAAASMTPDIAEVSALSNTPSMTASASLSPVAAEVSVSAPSILTLAAATSITVNVAEVSTATLSPSLTAAVTITPAIAEVSATALQAALTAAASISPTAASVSLQGASPALTAALQVTLQAAVARALANLPGLTVGAGATEGIYEAAANALRDAVGAELEDALGLVVIYDDQPEPAKGEGPWCRVMVSFPEAEQTHVGATRHHRLGGDVRIGVYLSLETGDASIWSAVDSLRAALTNAQLATGNSEAPTVTLRAPEVEIEGEAEGRWWRADIRNPFYMDAEVSAP